MVQTVKLKPGEVKEAIKEHLRKKGFLKTGRMVFKMDNGGHRGAWPHPTLTAIEVEVERDSN